MATLRAVKNRIRSVVNTKRITKAMEMVSAAKLRRAQQRVEQARPYAEILDEMLSRLAAASSGDLSHPYFEEREVSRRTLVVVTSDRGLCGSFNANINRRGIQLLEDKADADWEIVTVGKKGNDFFKRRRWPIAKFWGDWSGVIHYDKARDIVRFLTERFLSSETDEIYLLYTRFLSTVKYQIVSERYLPIPRPETGSTTGANTDYIFEPSPESIYDALLPNYAVSKMINALAESFASEHGSRMIAMGNATTNAEEMVDRLTLDYNKARQAQITKELLEIVSGAEALKG